MKKTLKVIILLTFCLAIFRYLNPKEYRYPIEEQRQILNNYLSEKYQNQYKLYSAYFNKDDDIPDIGKYDKNAILWLGRQPLKISKQLIPNLQKFGIILSSDFAKKKVIERFAGKKMYQFPEFSVQETKIIRNPRYYALIGDPQYAQRELKKRKLKYKKYSFNNLSQLKSDLKELKGIIIEEEKKQLTFNMDPVLLEALLNEIPIAENKTKNRTSSEALVGETVEYYFDKKEFIDILNKIENNEEKNNLDWIKENFTTAEAEERLKTILNSHKNLIKFSNVINIDTHDTTGFHAQGDIWLIHDLLDKMDHRKEYNITFADTPYRVPSSISIYIRGEITELEDKQIDNKKILYIAYPVYAEHTSFDNYMKAIIEINTSYNNIVVASKQMQDYLQKHNIKSEWIPQFTNIDKFYPDYDASRKSEILFVGNYYFDRKSAVYAKKNNLPITIYGNRWPKGWATAKYVDNRVLRKYYSSAKIVLSDQLKSMTDFGVIVNRIYDATACNTLVISEYVPEIENVYGDCVPMWKSEKELVSLIKYYLAHEEERKQKAQCAYEITLENFTSDIVAKKFNKMIEELENE